MNSLSVVAFACVIALASARPGYGHGHGYGPAVVVGASGVVTGSGTSGPAGHVNGNGAIGPNGEHNAVGGHWDGDDGHWGGAWDGAYGGAWDGAWGAHSNVVHGNGATLIGPGVGHAVVAGPVAHGAALIAGHGLDVGAWGVGLGHLGGGHGHW